MTVGGYDGSAPQSADWDKWSIASIPFGARDTITVYTAPEDDLSQYNSDPAIPSFAAPTGDITNGVASLELDSWIMWWNSTTFSQGSTSTKGAKETCVTTNQLGTQCSTPIVINSYDASTGAFDATWDSVFIGGAFNGVFGNWHITGNMSTVPVPAAVWLFGSGLIGLFCFTRRKKA